MNIANFFAVISINLNTKKVILNELAKKIFENYSIQDIIKNLDLNKKVDFYYLDKELYVINILKEENFTYLLFSKIENSKLALKKLKVDNNTIDLYQKDMLKEFLEKLMALKKRYSVFRISFLYFKLTLNVNIINLKNDILKYCLKITRSSDVVAQISEDSFGIILTSSKSEAGKIVTNKILKYINDINLQNGKRIVELYGALGHERFLFQYSNFDEIIMIMQKNITAIKAGKKIKELI